MGFDQHGNILVPMSLLMIAGNVYVWSQIVSLWIVAPAAIVFLALSLDPFGGVFISGFIQTILLGIGMGILDNSGPGEVDAVSSTACCGSSEVGVTRTLQGNLRLRPPGRVTPLPVTLHKAMTYSQKYPSRPSESLYTITLSQSLVLFFAPETPALPVRQTVAL